MASKAIYSSCPVTWVPGWKFFIHSWRIEPSESLYILDFSSHGNRFLSHSSETFFPCYCGDVVSAIRKSTGRTPSSKIRLKTSEPKIKKSYSKKRKIIWSCCREDIPNFILNQTEYFLESLAFAFFTFWFIYLLTMRSGEVTNKKSTERWAMEQN